MICNPGYVSSVKVNSTNNTLLANALPPAGISLHSPSAALNHQCKQLMLLVLLLHLAVWLLLLGSLYRRHTGAIPPLAAATKAHDSLPRVCVFVPARNEEAAIERAVRSLMNQRYANLRVVVADDNSTDRTGEILARLAREFPSRLSVINVPEPPEGWMGKCHALWHAVRRAPGEYDLLLFTDADVVHHRNTLRRAVRHLARDRADLLAIFPRVDCLGFWESATMPLLFHSALLKFDPGKLNNPREKEVIGIGAFTLIRRETYEKWGGHKAIRGEVLDDVAMGLMTKRVGGRIVLAKDPIAVRLRMYDGLGEVVRGFEKNANAAMGGGMLRAVVLSALFAVIHLVPVIGLLWAIGVGSAALAAVSLVAWLAVGEGLRRRTTSAFNFNPVGVVIGWPLGTGACVAIFIRSAWHSTVRGEVPWRGRRTKRGEQQVRLV